jgi:predicted Fe-Mo cluster-binding NifX family protein
LNAVIRHAGSTVKTPSLMESRMGSTDEGTLNLSVTNTVAPCKIPLWRTLAACNTPSRPLSRVPTDAMAWQPWQEACFHPGAMRVAIPCWQGRVSPVFDAAGTVLVIDIENGREHQREERPLTRTDVLARAGEFLKLCADVLICGAISAPLEATLVSSGVRVLGFVCGPIEEVLAAFLDGELARQAFWMPGCGGRRRRLGQGRETMLRGSGMGLGRGRGGGGGRGGSRGGRMGGPLAGGPGGECVCPNCGEKAPHTAGQPCNQMKCPKCGTSMTRA